MRRRSAPLPLAAAALAALALGGCGDGDEKTPVACLESPMAYVAALDSAPGEVKLQGVAAISECLPENQAGGALATVGRALVLSAVALNGKARQGDRAAALQLGYLVGAARRAAGETSGIHSDLLRRLESAAGYSPSGLVLPPSVARPYREGLRAGEARG